MKMKRLQQTPVTKLKTTQVTVKSAELRGSEEAASMATKTNRKIHYFWILLELDPN